MSDELSEMVRAAVRDEALAAESEFPYSGAILGRFVRDVRRRRAAGGAMLAVASLVVIGAAALGLGRPWQAVPPVTSTPTPTPSVSASPTPTPTVEPTPTLSPSSTPTVTTTPAPDPTTPPPETTPVAVPGEVTGVGAENGGGSGEIVAYWDGVADATGYRVYRSTSPDGPFDRSASYDVATDETTVETNLGYEYISFWSSSPQHFAYVESMYTQGPIYFRVTAFNSGGEGPPSVVVCGSPVGYPDC